MSEKIFKVKVQGRQYPFTTLNEASAIVQQLRDATGLGASKFGVEFPITDASGKKVGHVSYNGRVWDTDGRQIWPELSQPTLAAAEAAYNRQKFIETTAQYIFDDLPEKFKGGVTPQSYHVAGVKLADAVEKKDVEFLREYLGHGRGFNDASKKAFFQLLGQKVPTTIAGIRAAIDAWAGVSPEERAATDAAKKQADDTRAANKHYQALRTRLNAAKVRDGSNGLVAGYADHIDRWIAEGYRSLETVKRGAVPRYYLACGDRFRAVSGDALEYSRLALERASIAAAHDNLQVVEAPHVSEEQARQIFNQVL